MDIQKEVKTLEDLICKIKKYANEEHDKSSPCPLKHNHYHLSIVLGSMGCWKWNCVFCGESFSE